MSDWIRSSSTAFLLPILLGFAISCYQLDFSVPAYPRDLITYAGGYYAYEDGLNPYSQEDIKRSLVIRGVELDPYPYVYSPAFLILLLPLRFLSLSVFKMLWIYGGIAAGWLALHLLTCRMKGCRKRKWAFLLASFVFLVFSDTLRNNAVWGNISSLLFLALALAVSSSFKGFRTVISSAFVVISKVGFWPLAFFQRDRSTLLRSLLLLSVIFICAGLIFGFGLYADWTDSIRDIGDSFRCSWDNNFSITHIISITVQTRICVMDRERASLDSQYRVDTLNRQSSTAKLIYYSTLLAGALTVALLLYGRFRSGDTFYDVDTLFSAAVLFLLTFMPYIWIHYGLILVFPLRVLFRRDSLWTAILFPVSMLLWGSSIETPLLGVFILPVWIRFLIPLIWTFVFLKQINPQIKIK